MGREKAHKPRHERGQDRGRPDWAGTAFHSTGGMHHPDVRASGDGVLITASPAEVDGGAAVWQARLRNDERGELRAFGAALASGSLHGLHLDDEDRQALLFLPDDPGTGVGSLVRATRQDGKEEVPVDRRAERPLALWAEAGANLLRILDALGPATTAPAPDDSVFTACPGCARPVFEDDPAAMLVGSVTVPGLCRLCADGSTSRHAHLGPLTPQQRIVLDAVAEAGLG
ncbi:hypothetical protein ACU686_13235 [Yinghuangia aomiensis]